MVMDVIDRCTQLIVGESWWTGKPIPDFRVVAQNSRTRRVEQGLSKEIRCRVLDARRRRKRCGDFVQERVWRRKCWYKVERSTDPHSIMRALPNSCGRKRANCTTIPCA